LFLKEAESRKLLSHPEERTTFDMSLQVENVKQMLINTGNILSLNNITKNPAQNPTEELIEAINLTIKDYKEVRNLHNGTGLDQLLITRTNDDFYTKIVEQDITDLKIGLKIFLSSDDPCFLREAIEKALDALNVPSIQNVIIAYKSLQIENSHDEIKKLQDIWRVLEDYVQLKKVQQIGLADVEESTFRKIYEWSSAKPSIVQINLATCCVVPPTLQAFCKDNDIQLLTHSDPADILPKASCEEIFGKPFKLNWAVRYSIHIKCRGVLTTKGYLISINNH